MFISKDIQLEKALEIIHDHMIAKLPLRRRGAAQPSDAWWIFWLR